MATKTLLLVLTLILVGCPQTGPGPTPPSPSPPPPDPDGCALMCAHIGPKDKGGLGCEEGTPVYDSDIPGPKGVPNETCEQFCAKQIAAKIHLNPRCIATVKSCPEIESARTKTCS